VIIPFVLNGSKVYSDSNPGERLVHVLRRRFSLLGSHEGCLSGRCGSCMVLLNEAPVPSCIIPVFQVRNCSVITIEEFSKTADYRDIIEGFESAGVAMCGFCNTGKIFIAHSILSQNLRPSKEDIRELFSGNMCRCTSIDDLVVGVKNAGLIRRKRQNVK
jgi:aerobic carbon-monoxide dehydrogenase small subunit